MYLARRTDDDADDHRDEDEEREEAVKPAQASQEAFWSQWWQAGRRTGHGCRCALLRVTRRVLVLDVAHEPDKLVPSRVLGRRVYKSLYKTLCIESCLKYQSQ